MESMVKLLYTEIVYYCEKRINRKNVWKMHLRLNKWLSCATVKIIIKHNILRNREAPYSETKMDGISMQAVWALGEKMKAFKKVWSVFTTVVVILAVILAVGLVGVRLVGIQLFTVLSGSMEPTYHVGSLIYVKPVDYKELKVGDPITFMLNETTVATHRIVEVVPDESDPQVLRFRTKGDANDAVDGGLVHYKNVIGKPIFTVPGLGYAVDYIQNPPGTYVAIAGVAVLLLLLFLPDLLAPSKKKEKKEE